MPFDEGYLGVQEDPTWMEYEAIDEFPATQVVSDEQEQEQQDERIEETQDAIPDHTKKAEREEDHHELTLKLKPKKRKFPIVENEERMLRRRLTEEELTFRTSLRRHSRDDREFWQLLTRQRLRRERETRQDQNGIVAHLRTHLKVVPV